MRDECCAAKSPYIGDCCESRPEPMMASYERAKAREINIQPMNYGYLVRVGCQSFVFETKEKMVTNLTSYLEDPENVERSKGIRDCTSITSAEIPSSDSTSAASITSLHVEP